MCAVTGSLPLPLPVPLPLPLASSPTPTPNQVRRYWVQNLSGPGVSHDDDGDGWFSRANLFLALYAEVEAQGRGEGHATDAAESLFGSRLAGVPYPYPYHYPYP